MCRSCREASTTWFKPAVALGTLYAQTNATAGWPEQQLQPSLTCCSDLLHDTLHSVNYDLSHAGTAQLAALRCVDHRAVVGLQGDHQLVVVLR